MRAKQFAAAAAALWALAMLAYPVSRAQAIPLFAQRYRLQCSACHSVIPELNAFGTYFREHGYRLPLPKHGTTGIAVRYQMEYEQRPAAGSRRFSPGGVLLSNADIGAISAFVHYNLGAGGGPSALFLAYLASYNAHTQSLYRLGLIELPLAQSPAQRLDDLAPYGYYGSHVGLNDLPLSSPRWGLQLERTAGAVRLDAIADLGEYQGSAYGGKPIATGEKTSAQQPELGLFARTTIAPGFDIGGETIEGARSIVPSGRHEFVDAYRRAGLLSHLRYKKLDVQAEQWWGTDDNADGFGTRTGSSGGYLRIKYYPTPHFYAGIRYDAAATPFVTRDFVYYAAFSVMPHARLLLQQVHTLGAGTFFGGALTVGFPWPLKL